MRQPPAIAAFVLLEKRGRKGPLSRGEEKEKEGGRREEKEGEGETARWGESGGVHSLIPCTFGADHKDRKDRKKTADRKTETRQLQS